MKKRAIVLSLVAAMAVTAAAVPTIFADEPAKTVTSQTANPTNPFVDTYGSWAEKAVQFVYTQGLFKGVEETRFDLEGLITGGQMTTVLYRMSGAQTQNNAGGLWYEESVAWAQRSDVIDGVNGFDPEKALTREEMVMIMYNYYKANAAVEENYDGMALNEFGDEADITDAYKTAVRWAVKNGVIQGDENQKLNPKANVTRAEAAQIFYSYMNKEETAPTATPAATADANATATPAATVDTNATATPAATADTNATATPVATADTNATATPAPEATASASPQAK